MTGVMDNVLNDLFTAVLLIIGLLVDSPTRSRQACWSCSV